MPPGGCSAETTRSLCLNPQHSLSVKTMAWSEPIKLFLFFVRGYNLRLEKCGERLVRRRASAGNVVISGAEKLSFGPQLRSEFGRGRPFLGDIQESHFDRPRAPRQRRQRGAAGLPDECNAPGCGDGGGSGSVALCPANRLSHTAPRGALIWRMGPPRRKLQHLPCVSVKSSWLTTPRCK